MIKALKLILLGLIVLLVVFCGWMNVTSGYFQPIFDSNKNCVVVYEEYIDEGRQSISDYCNLSSVDRLILILEEFDFNKPSKPH